MPSALRVMVLGTAAEAEALLPPLRAAGYAADCRAVDTNKAFLAALETPPDIILATGTRAGLDALGALDQLRRWRLDIPILAIAAHGNGTAAGAGGQLGGVYHLPPDKLHSLGEAVSAALAPRRAHPRDTPPPAAPSPSPGQEANRAAPGLTLADERNLMRTLIDNMPDLIYVKDTQSRFVLANFAVARIMCGGVPADLLGKTDADFYPPEMAAGFRQDEERIMQSGEPLVDRIESAVDPQGGRKWLSTTKVPLRNGAGQIAGLVGLGRDITRRIETEQALQEAEAERRDTQKLEALGNLAGGIACDFNNSLCVVTATCELLLMRLVENDPLRRDLLDIKEAGERAAELVRHLLAFNQGQTPQPAVLDLNALISEMSPGIRRQLGPTIQLVTRPEPALGRIKADRKQLEHLLETLVTNARDAMPTGGVLFIETTRRHFDDEYCRRRGLGVCQGPFVMLAVSDTGCGMPEYVRAHLFEPFFSTTKSGPGVGLGLATVRHLVRQNGGDMVFHSVPGQGTTFKVFLPCFLGPDDPPPAPRQPSPASGRETILLVDADRAAGSLARRFLTVRGYVVLEASGLQEAIALAAGAAGKDEVVDLILLDAGLRAEKEGLVQRLLELCPEARLLLSSGFGEAMLRHHGQLPQGGHLLPKPFTADALATAVRRAIDGGEPAGAAGAAPKPGTDESR